MEEDYSPSSTTVVFSRPIHLLRGPIPAGGLESGPYVLAFRSLDSWAAAFKRCETIIKDQCEEGARIGCAVSASNNCKTPWWYNSKNMSERDKCEEQEFKECMGAAKSKCAGLAKEKCSGAYLDARIAVAGDADGLLRLASMPEESRWLDQLTRATRKTNCRARDLLNQKSM